MDPQRKKQATNLLLQIVPYAIGSLVIYKGGEALGLWESPRTKRLGEKFRALPYLQPDWYKLQLKVNSAVDAANLLFDKNDLYKVQKLAKSLATTLLSKGAVWDSEETAITSLKSNIKSKIDASLYSDVFLYNVKDNLVEYLDTYLENRYQVELLKYFENLPILTVKEQSILETRTGKKITFKGNNIIFNKK
jgi:hypothetical protein